jgi:hypothetical protein
MRFSAQLGYSRHYGAYIGILIGQEIERPYLMLLRSNILSSPGHTHFLM